MAEPTLLQQAQTWDAVAPTYAEDIGQWRAYVDEAVRLVPVHANERVLDIATGPGTLAFVAAGAGARVTAVDFSPGMIDALRARAARERVTNIDAAVMDASELAFPDGSFDAVYCMFAFFVFPDRARVFREMHRVLLDGGRALIATWAPIDRRPMMKIGIDAMAEALPDFPRPTKGDLQDPEECIREMTAGGFKNVETRTVTASLRVTSPEHYADVIIRSGAPLAAMKKKIGDAAFAAVRGKFLEAIRTRIPEAGAELSAEAILTYGIK